MDLEGELANSTFRKVKYIHRDGKLSTIKIKKVFFFSRRKKSFSRQVRYLRLSF
jgi:hypothetical protein